MLFLDGVYVERSDGCVRFRWVKAPTSAELTQLTDRIARHVGRFLERQGLLERDAQHSYLAGESVETDPAVIKTILTHLDAKNASTVPSHSPPCRAPPPADLFD